MKKIYALLLAFAILCLPTPSPSGEPNKILHQRCLYPTVLVFDEEEGYGSGVIVQSLRISANRYLNVILTCDHVVNCGHHFRVSIPDYKDWSRVKTVRNYPAYIYAGNQEIDMAVLCCITKQRRPVAKMDFTQDLYVGDEVYGVGCALRDSPRLDYGKITQVLTPHHWRTSIFTVPGDSGGPVFSKYKLIGLKQAIAGIPFAGISMPLFDMSRVVPVTPLLNWNQKEEGALSFVYKASPAPRLPVLMLNAARLREPAAHPSSGTPTPHP